MQLNPEKNVFTHFFSTAGSGEQQLEVQEDHALGQIWSDERSL